MEKLGSLFSRLTAVIWKYLPWEFNLYFARLLAFVWVDLFRIRRDIILKNIETAFPQMSLREREDVGKKSMIALCRSFFDVMKIPSLDDRWIDENVIFEGGPALEEVKQSQDGIFFLSLHLGSGDLAGVLISRRVKPLTIISKRFTNKFLDAFWFGLRERSTTKFINAHGKSNAFEILGALKQKRGVAFVLDQFMGKPYGVESKFFGVTTGTAYGLALFAKKTKKSVYPLYTYWDERNKLHVCIDAKIDLSAELSETNEVLTDKFNSVLEGIITKYPEHWMWVHKRWKTFE